MSQQIDQMEQDKYLLTNRFEVKFFSVLGAVLVGILILLFILTYKVERGNISSPAKLALNPFDKIELVAHSAYVYDIRTSRVLYAKNSNERLPLASLTKVMTAVVALDTTPSYSTITINRSAIMTGGDSGLRVGEKWTLRDLLDFSLTSSSNDGVAAIAFALGALPKANITESSAMEDFVAQMNRKANELQMKNTYFFNVTGLDETNVRGGAYGTAEDMARLFSYALIKYPYIFEATSQKQFKISSLDNIIHTATNTDAIVNDIPGLRGSKTGFTTLAGGNLVIAFDPEIGRPIIISVLGSTEKDRFVDILKLVNATIASLSQEAEK